MKHLNFLLLLIFITFSQNLDADEILDIGKNIFLEKGNCATCHALADAGSNGDIGPNLNYIKPDVVHIMIDGKIVKSGDMNLAKEVEEKGYSWILE